MRVAPLLVLLAAVGCHGVDTPSAAPASTPFVVSTPRSDIAPATTGDTHQDVAWVALPAGTIPDADVVTIRVLSTGQTVTAKSVDGGLDPVPVFAELGDELQLTVTKTGSTDVATYAMAIARSKGPIVIRTRPAPIKRDVPLNAVIVVVFSEPLSPASLTPSAVTLTKGNIRVPVQIGFADSNHVSAQFVPDAPLEPATDYTFTLSQAIQNMAGQPLLAPLVLHFTTTNSPAPSGIANFHVTGTVTDDADTPLPGADIYFSPYVPGGPANSQVRITTDSDGKFAIDFSSEKTGIPGSAPTDSPVIAFAFAYKDGYVWDNRYVLANGISNLHFTLFRPTWITPGDSVLLTVTPNDGICSNNGQDMHPMPDEWRCRTIYVLPSGVEGTLHLAIGPTCQKFCLGVYAEALDTVVNGVRMRADEAYGARFGAYNWLSFAPSGELNVPMLPVFPMMVEIEVPWLDDQAETVWLHTSFTPAPQPTP